MNDENKISLTLIGIFIAVMTLIIIIYLTDFRRKPNPKPNPIPFNDINGTLGQSETGTIDLISNGKFFKDRIACEKSGRGVWENTTCKCCSPFFGSSCEREAYLNIFTAVGNPILTDLTMTSTNQNTDRNSFANVCITTAQTECNNLCTDTCKGFIFNDGVCTLITSDISTNKIIPYNNNENSIFFIKTLDSLKFDNMVFLYSINKPLRYWLDPRVSQLSKGVTSQINIIPTDLVNMDNLTGYYSSKLFSTITDPNITYIHQPNTPLKIPSNMQIVGLFVQYS